MATIEVPSKMMPSSPYRFTPEDATYIVIDCDRWRIADLPPMVERLEDVVKIDAIGVLFSIGT